MRSFRTVGPGPVYVTVWYYTGTSAEERTSSCLGSWQWQLEDSIARPRPQTSAYPVITAAFSSALLEIAGGYDVQQALDTGISQIDGNLAANGFYRTPEP